MALLAEEIVQEWLNRQGYFTIRGVKTGIHEIYLLAVRFGAAGLECRQIEVQASVRPVSYLTRVPKAIQEETGRAAGSAKLRLADELRQVFGSENGRTGCLSASQGPSMSGGAPRQTLK